MFQPFAKLLLHRLELNRGPMRHRVAQSRMACEATGSIFKGRHFTQLHTFKQVLVDVELLLQPIQHPRLVALFLWLDWRAKKRLTTPPLAPGAGGLGGRLCHVPPLPTTTR